MDTKHCFVGLILSLEVVDKVSLEIDQVLTIAPLTPTGPLGPDCPGNPLDLK